MDLHHLKYFVTVADEGNVHRASARLKIAPSALSRRILDLEAELQVALFERQGGSLTLSYAGGVLMTYARALLGEVEATAEHFRRLGRGHTDLLRIGLSGVAPQLGAVQALIRAFRDASPEVELSLPSLASSAQLDAVRRGEIDAGLLFALPDDSDEFDHVRLASHRLVAVMPAYHRLAGHSHLQIADLRDEDIVLFTRASRPQVHDRILAECRSAGVELRIVQEAEGERTLMGLVAAGMGLSLMNETITSRQSRPHLVARSVTDLTVREHLDLAWPAGEPAPALARMIALAGAAAVRMS